jgi:hypothetical protein
MASAKTVSLDRLRKLGADRLAELLIDLAERDAALKRRLRIEIASQGGSKDVAAAVRKRLATIGKSKSYVDWQKMRPFVDDLAAQHKAIITHVAPSDPREAAELLWMLLDLAPGLYDRCDDSNGAIGGVLSTALEDLATTTRAAKMAPTILAKKVFAAACANDYGQFDDVISLMADSLGKEGLQLLKADFEALSASPKPAKAAKQGYALRLGPDGPVAIPVSIDGTAYRIRAVLSDIADALGDVDGFIVAHSQEERTRPNVAADIAIRLLAAKRTDEALASLEAARPNLRSGGSWGSWQETYIAALDQAGRGDEAQTQRWSVFEQSFNVAVLRDYLKKLPDFEDVEAEERAIAYAAGYRNLNVALDFLLQWPALEAAAALVLRRHKELNGNFYQTLSPLADALDQRYPLAATLALRSMIDFSLEEARTSRYGHAARHLDACAILAKRIADFGSFDDHNAFVARLKAKHGRKASFWVNVS